MSLIGFQVNIKEGAAPTRDFSMFRIAAMEDTLRGLGSRLFVYSPRRIDPNTGLVTGLLIEDGRFVSSTEPVPTVNGCWYIGRDKSSRPMMNALESRAWAAENGIEIYPLQSFSKILKDKLKSSRLVRKFDSSLHPKTEAYQGTLEQLTKFVERYRLVFLKPRFGSKGDNIFSIRRRRRGLRCAYYSAGQKHETMHRTVEDALAAIDRVVGSQRFLIQQGIAIDRHDDAPYIFRVIMLDDGKEWQWVQKAVLAAPGSDIANTTQGGSNWQSIDLLARIYGDNRAKELFEELRRVSFECTHYLDKHFPGQLMEVAFDFVMNRKQQLKILEINTLPGMTKPGLPPEPAFSDILNRKPGEREIYEQFVLPHGSCLAKFLHTRLEEHEAQTLHPGTFGPAGVDASSVRGDDVTVDPGLPLLEQAVARQAKHLVRACLEDGSFYQHQDSRPSKVDPRFEVLRHAGAIYALARYARWQHDAEAREAALRAGGFLKANYIAPVPGEGSMLAVWSRSEFNHLGEPDQIKLGWVGLGLVALICLERHSPGFTTLEELRALGEFLCWGQNADGSFDCLYLPEQGGWKTGWKSFHYPGQAAFALSMLYAIDPLPRWLESASRAIDYLVRSRDDNTRSRADYWTLLAMARLLPFCNGGQPAGSRAAMVDYSKQICRHILNGQIRRSINPEFDGGFDSHGRTQPTATRLRGLLAARTFMQREDPVFDAWLQTATRDGIDFLLRACTRDAKISAMPRAMALLPENGSGRNRSFNRRASEIRIDYAQHALSAMIQYALLTDTCDVEREA